MKKQWISVKCGLSRDPKHRQSMGESVWLFLHILDIASWDDGMVHDWKDEAAAEEMGMPVRTLREHRRKLDELGYISCIQKQYTQDIVIHNWTNPREYNGQVYNQKQGYSETETSKDTQGYTQGYIQGSRKDVTPTLYSKNQISTDISSKQNIAGVEASIWQDRPTTIDDLPVMQTALEEFESALSLPANWQWYPAKTSDEPGWCELREFILAEWQKDAQAFRKYAAWRATLYVKGAMSNLAIRRAPAEFIISWSDFLAHSSMYGKKDQEMTRLL